jgi:hypothetical protein
MNLVWRTFLSGIALLALNLAMVGASHAQTDRFGTLATLPFEQNRLTQKTAETLKEELIFQRATQTYLWAMPLLNTMGMRDGYAESFGAGYNTMAIWTSAWMPRPASPRPIPISSTG